MDATILLILSRAEWTLPLVWLREALSDGQPCPTGFVPAHSSSAKTFSFVSVTRTLLWTGEKDETGQGVNKQSSCYLKIMHFSLAAPYLPNNGHAPDPGFHVHCLLCLVLHKYFTKCFKVKDQDVIHSAHSPGKWSPVKIIVKIASVPK